MSKHFRWLVALTYRTAHGDGVVDHMIEELDELRDLVEAGPDWNALAEIRITLNPRRRSYVATVEQTEKM